MKKLFFLVICFLYFSAGAVAHTEETFDVATFTAPKGWARQAGQNSIQFSISTEAEYCLINLFKSTPGVGSSKENFNAAWGAVVKESVTAMAAPEMAVPSIEDGWEIQTGYAPFENDGVKGIAMLVTASGFGKMVNALILTNTQSYEPAITAFLRSIKLKKPETVEKPPVETPVETPTVNSGAISVTSNIWTQTQNRKDMGGYAGYSSNTYQFFPNNAYKFSQVTFQNYSPKYYLEDEEGTYKIIGRTITLMPKKGTYRTHKSSRQDPVLKSGNLELKTAQYNFEFMDLNDNQTLLLSPVNGVETKRDGGFSFWLNGQPQKTYAYKSVSAEGNLLNAAGQVK